jgi:hypothetical protein
LTTTDHHVKGSEDQPKHYVTRGVGIGVERVDDGNESATVTEFRIGLEEDDFRRDGVALKSQHVARTPRRTTRFTVNRALDKLEIIRSNIQKSLATLILSQFLQFLIETAANRSTAQCFSNKAR